VICLDRVPANLSIDAVVKAPVRLLIGFGACSEDVRVRLRALARGPHSQYKQPPTRVAVHPSLIVQYTMHSSNYWDPRQEEREYEEMRASAGGGPRSARRSDNVRVFRSRRLPDLPRLFPNVIARSVRCLREMGFRYFQTQAGDGYALNGLNYYVLSKVLWDPALDPDAIMRDYVERGFGKAAPFVERYFSHGLR
jgi:hypothetical protein